MVSECQYRPPTTTRMADPAIKQQTALRAVRDVTQITPTNTTNARTGGMVRAFDAARIHEGAAVWPVSAALR